MKAGICAWVLGLGLTMAGIAGAQDTSKINGDVVVAAGQTAGDVQTINGDIHVGARGHVDEAKTVNGGITLGQHATAGSLEAVNGEITLARDVHVKEDVGAVNGDITLHEDAEVQGGVSNVTGQILLKAADVGDGLETVAGDITVGANSHVEGGIEVEKPNHPGFHYHSSHPHTPRIVIGPHAVVDGKLEFHRKVELYVSDSAKIGPLSGATAHTFSGAAPSP